MRILTYPWGFFPSELYSTLQLYFQSIKERLRLWQEIEKGKKAPTSENNYFKKFIDSV